MWSAAYYPMRKCRRSVDAVSLRACEGASLPLALNLGLGFSADACREETDG